jgi:hypothetical protein
VQRLFQKKISGHTDHQIQKLVYHAQEIAVALETSEFLTPRVVSHSNDTINYEHLNIPFRIDTSWQKNLKLDSLIFTKIGQILYLIHNKSKDHLLHGDFVLHNIFLNSTGALCVIDCHPPEVIGYDKSFLYGDQEAEMHLFLLNLSSSLGIKRALFNISQVRRAMRSFRQGYGAGGTLRSLTLAIVRFYKIRRKSGFSKLNVFTHLMTATFIIGTSSE